MLFISDSFNSSGTSNMSLSEINLCFPSSFQLSMWAPELAAGFLLCFQRRAELTEFLAQPPPLQADQRGQESKGKCLFLETSCWLAASRWWWYYFQRSRGPDEYRPEVIMVAPNCRVHITLDNGARRQGRNVALRNSPLERCVSEIKMFQLHEYAHGDLLPGQCAPARLNAPILIALCCSNCAVILGQKNWKSSWPGLWQRGGSLGVWKCSACSLFPTLPGKKDEQLPLLHSACEPIQLGITGEKKAALLMKI